MRKLCSPPSRGKTGDACRRRAHVRRPATDENESDLMRLLVRFFGFLFSVGVAAVALVGATAIGYLVYVNTRDLPDYTQLQDYEPPVMTRVHAADGVLLAEYARERRLYLPIQVVSPRVIHAFLSAEDKNFYSIMASTPKASCAPSSPISRIAARASARRAPRPSPSRSPRTSS